MIKFISWNLNSLRARFEHLEALIFRESPDFILLQEVRCDETKLDKEKLEDLGYNISHSLFGGRSGVMIMSKHLIENVEVSFCQNTNIQNHCNNFNVEHINEGRYIEITSVINNKSFCIASVYFPNGGNSAEDDKNFPSIEQSERFNYKLAFYKDFISHAKNLQTKADYIVIGGDYNVARNNQDVYNPKAFEGLPCFHPYERKLFEELLQNNYIDYFREQNPSNSEYTWWDYRKASYAQNKGLRIDYIITNHKLASLITNYQHLTFYRELEKPSDHCPVVLEVKI